MSLRNVSIKAMDLDFTIATSINLTEDCNIIQRELDAFNGFCKTFEEGNYTRVHQHCINVEKEAAKEIQGTLKNLKDSYNMKVKRSSGYYQLNRPPRSIGGLITGTAKQLFKYSPQIAMGLGIVYQTYENQKLENHVEVLKTKIKTVSNLMFNISETEYEAASEQLNILLDQQRQLDLETKINDYSSTVQLLAAQIVTKHQSIINLKPLKELQQYVTELDKKLNSFALPQLDDMLSIFTLNRAIKSIKNELVHVTFKIPLVQKMKFREFAIITVPTSEGEAIIAGNQQLAHRVVLDEKNSTMF